MAARAATFACALSLATPLGALDDVRFRVAGDDDGLRDRLREASLLIDAEEADTDNVQELLATIRAEYGRLLAALYAQGYFGPTISIEVDGREASTLTPLELPQDISRITVRVEPGPRYRFGEIGVGPLARGTELPEGFARGETADTGAIRAAAAAAVTGWRDAGHPKADAGAQRIVARHEANRLDAQVEIVPGPQAVLGNLRFAGEGAEAVRMERLRRIAGWPSGDVFDPALLRRTAERLQRTGTFRSVALTEAETVGPDGRLDVTATLVAEAPRRFGFGAEIDTVEGLTVSAFWLHRNLLRGAERLRVEGEVAGIGGGTGGTDYKTALTFGRPGSRKSDTDFFATAALERLNEPDFTSTQAILGAGYLRRVGERLILEAGLGFRFSREEDASGETDYALFLLPIGAEYERRDDPLNPTDGYYVELDLTPFAGLNEESGSGARLTGDMRGYHGFGAEERVVAAARLQFGSIVGADLTEVPNDYRFYSGGGGTVRGQDYQSLGVLLPGGIESGGASYAGLSAELRAGVTEKIQVVGFYDYGYVSEDSLPFSGGDSHSGAGLGLRYLTTIGPIRLDFAVPVSGEDDGGFQVYVGIGQSF